MLPLANGRWSVAAAAWIAPALLVRFLRGQSIGRALVGGWLAMSVAEFFWWKGIIPLSGAAYVAAAIVFGAINVVPYLIDRVLAPRIGGFAATVVLPSAMVVHEALSERVSPFGSWGSYAYTQSSNLPLLQVLSVTGIAGLTFLVLWFATIVNWIAETSDARMRVRRAIACILVLAAVHLPGAVRLARATDGPRVRVAAITPRIPTYTIRGDVTNGAVHEALATVRRGRALDAAGADAFRRRAAAINEELLSRSEREAASGAKLIVWSEGAGIVDARDENALVASAARVAGRTRAFLAVSYLVLDTAGGKRFANRNVLFDAEGRVAWSYDKAKPVPGMEDNLRPGSGRVPLAQSPFARLAGVICFDLDFPSLLQQAGLGGADIVLVPADDWDAVAPTHARMAKFRAIEHGFSIIRPTSSGTSVAYDRLGRTIAAADYFAGERTLTASVTAHGVPTLYTRAPNLVLTLAIMMLIAAPLVAFARRVRFLPGRQSEA